MNSEALDLGPERQRTVAGSVSCSGVALHCGRRTSVTVHPAPEGNGVVFRRTDRRGDRAVIPALWHNAVNSPLCTTLASPDGTQIRTVEHLLCALYASEVDNVVVEVEGEELPILDGSAAPFVELLQTAGRVVQRAPRRRIEVLRRIDVCNGRSRISIEPAERLRVDLTLALPDFGLMRWQGAADPVTVRREIAPARTFGRLTEALPVMIAGWLGGPKLLRGASLRSAVALYGRHVLNRGGLRMSDEPVRHRVVDCLGDLALAGAQLSGAVTAVRTWHGFNRRLVATLMADRGAWRWAESAPLDIRSAFLGRDKS